MSDKDSDVRQKLDKPGQMTEDEDKSLSKFLAIKYYVEVEGKTELQFRASADARLIAGLLKGAKDHEKNFQLRHANKSMLEAELLNSRPAKRGLALDAKWFGIGLIVLAIVAFFQSNPTALHSVQQYFQVYGLHIVVATTLIIVSAVYFMSRRRKKANA